MTPLLHHNVSPLATALFDLVWAHAVVAQVGATDAGNGFHLDDIVDVFAAIVLIALAAMLTSHGLEARSAMDLDDELGDLAGAGNLELGQGPECGRW